MSEAIALELPRQNVTVVGGFNPAVIQPPWVKRYVPSVEGEISTLLSLSGAPIHRADGLMWTVTTERLAVHGPADQAGRVVSQILRTLSHTPLQAAGVNFLVSGRADRARVGPFGVTARADGVRSTLHGSPAELSLTQVALRDDGVRLTARIVWPSELPDALLDLNYHLEASGVEPEERAKQLASHAERAAELESDARRISRELFGE